MCNSVGSWKTIDLFFFIRHWPYGNRLYVHANSTSNVYAKNVIKYHTWDNLVDLGYPGKTGCGLKKFNYKHQPSTCILLTGIPNTDVVLLIRIVWVFTVTVMRRIDISRITVVSCYKRLVSPWLLWLCIVVRGWKVKIVLGNV